MPSGSYERRPKPVSERFWKKIARRPTGCWEWTAKAKAEFGYGIIRISGRSVSAHRYSWELHNGPIPQNLNVLHRCDNPICCNPDHLFLGTKADNSQDMVQKNRAKRGEDLPHAKLTEREIVLIRKARGVLTQKQIADKFGISPGHVSWIQSRKGWTHI